MCSPCCYCQFSFQWFNSLFQNFHLLATQAGLCTPDSYNLTASVGHEATEITTITSHTSQNSNSGSQFDPNLGLTFRIFLNITFCYNKFTIITSDAYIQTNMFIFYRNNLQN
jgi:hypothetical protein